MENILVVGANTRPVAAALNSAGFNVYSADYFGCEDLIPCVKDHRSILKYEPNESTGFFSEKFNDHSLNEIASEFVDIVDHIICCSGADPAQFPKNKVLGNNDIKNVENKYKLYKTLKNRFEGLINIPATFFVDSLADANCIVEDNPKKKFLLKPIEGSGGIGITKFTPQLTTIDNNGAILQEVVDGQNISTSVISSVDEARTILVNWQLIGNTELGQLEQYGYCGNITPFTGLDQKSIDNLKDISEEIILDLGLIGSNGLDIIIKDGTPHIIEVNPRLQGSFEVAELSLGINMAQTHINACNGSLIKTTKPRCFAMKQIVFAKERSRVGNMNREGIYDLPPENVIIERGEAIITLVNSGAVLENTLKTGQELVSSVYQNLQPVPVKR
jgi:predicted ATP-grasp superfamily ATP-dependent carboligase